MRKTIASSWIILSLYITDQSIFLCRPYILRRFYKPPNAARVVEFPRASERQEVGQLSVSWVASRRWTFAWAVIAHCRQVSATAAVALLSPGGSINWPDLPVTTHRPLPRPALRSLSCESATAHPTVRSRYTQSWTGARVVSPPGGIAPWLPPTSAAHCDE